MVNNKWYTLKEASEYLSRCGRQIIRYVEDSRLKGYQSGYRGRWLFDIKDLDSFVMFQLPYKRLTKPQKRTLKDS